MEGLGARTNQKRGEDDDDDGDDGNGDDDDDDGDDGDDFTPSPFWPREFGLSLNPNAWLTLNLIPQKLDLYLVQGQIIFTIHSKE